MNINEELNKDLEAIQEKLRQLYSTYKELKRLGESDGHKETLKEGFLLKARKNTEKILKYICKKEGIQVYVKGPNGKIDESRIPMLNDYLQQLRSKKIIDNEIEIYLEIIKKWGNRNAHDVGGNNLEHDQIKASTIESVYDSFNSFIDWFFKKYEKGAKVDFSKNEYNSKEKVKELTPKELEEQRKKFMENPFGLPDYSVLQKSKKYKSAVSTQRRRMILRFLLRISVLSFIVYFFVKGLMGTGNNSFKDNTPLNKEKVYDLIIRYFNSSNQINAEAHEFFAHYVDTFYFKYKLSPGDIDIIQQKNNSYIDNKNEILKATLYPSSKNDSITRWRFLTKYTCYRPKLKRYQKNDLILMEFGITNYGKIKFIKQVWKTKEQYSEGKPI